MTLLSIARPASAQSEAPSARARDHDLISVGAALLLGGWTASVSGGAYYFSERPTMCPNTGVPLLFVPLIGPLGSALVLERCKGDEVSHPSGAPRDTTWDWIFGATLSALQTAGFVLALVGTYTSREIVVARDGEGAPTLRLELAPYPTLRF